MSQEQNTNLKRGLKSRHLSMIAMGGAIGTGIFLAMGDTLHQAGVGGAFVAYGIIFLVYKLRGDGNIYARNRFLWSLCNKIC